MVGIKIDQAAADAMDPKDLRCVDNEINKALEPVAMGMSEPFFGRYEGNQQQ